MTDQHLSAPPSPTPARGPGGWLGWVAAVVGVGAVAVLVYVATLLIGSARESREVARAERNLPAVGTYRLTGADLTEHPSPQWSVTATSAEVGESEVRVHLTWTNTSGQALVWACPGPVDLTRWRSASTEVSGAGAAASSAHCTRDEPADQHVAPGAAVQDWEAFPRDGAWGAGATRITAQLAQDDGDYGAGEQDPAVTFVVDLDGAAPAAG